MTITGHYTVVKEIKTYYETNNGPTDKPAIVCIHTAGRESRQYHWMMETLANKYQMIAMDMPAHGKSFPLPGNKAITDRQEYAEFIWAFIEKLGIKNPVVIGCSLGGNIVYQLAQDYPVSAIVSMQGADYTPTISEVSLALMNHPYVSLQHSHLDFSDSLIGKDPDPGARDFILWGVCQEIAITKKADLTIYSRGFDIRNSMHKIKCPVLVIRGEDDWIVDEESVEGTVSRITNSKKLVYKKIPGVGHFPAVEKPQLMCEIIDEFLTSL